MKTHRLVEWQYMLGLTILPLLLMGIILLSGLMMGSLQYNPVYFTENYVHRYQTPGALLEELEQAIRLGDAMKIAELQGTHWVPSTLEPIPNLKFSMFWDEDGKYEDYLYFDASNYQRYMFHIKLVDGRYVWAIENLYYYIDSGRWVRTFFPILAIWWIVLFLYVVTKKVYRVLTDFKPKIATDHIPK